MTKQGSAVIPSSCCTAAICAAASVVVNGTPAVGTSPSRAQSGMPTLVLTIHRMRSGAPACHATSRSRDKTGERRLIGYLMPPLLHCRRKKVCGEIEVFLLDGFQGVLFEIVVSDRAIFICIPHELTLSSSM
jgi:hypothetical protein